MSAGESARPVCAIYWDGDGAVIAEHGCWRPGLFTHPETARHAFAFGDEDIQRLQNVAIAMRGDRAITCEMLDTLGPPDSIPRVVVMSGRSFGWDDEPPPWTDARAGERTSKDGCAS